LHHQLTNEILNKEKYPSICKKTTETRYEKPSIEGFFIFIHLMAFQNKKLALRGQF